MGERIGRIGRIYTDFFLWNKRQKSGEKKKKKSVQIPPIRLIRSPIVSQLNEKNLNKILF
jgi:hypothetical protein